ncbi:hypothetical protein ALQ91_02817 [Pseudomonas syringae pv. syringae]|nr:hypothetical protein ALQ91_02817 [Pseudomonas syringae pv. syringae]
MPGTSMRAPVENNSQLFSLNSVTHAPLSFINTSNQPDG